LNLAHLGHAWVKTPIERMSMLRRYDVNSPQAAARIVALAVVADGDIGETEIQALDRWVAHEQLGLPRQALHGVLDAFCEDLLTSGQLTWADACPVDERTLADLMGEIQDHALRLKVLGLCVQLVEADGHVDEGESAVLTAAVEHWGLHREMLRAAPAR
jgi:uncharacterized tellurite resistance protein B-like protein